MDQGVHLLCSSSLCLEQALCYYLSGVQLFAVCVICPMILSLLGLFLCRRIIPSHFLRQSHDVTGPFFNTLGTVYGIFLAFVFSTTWQAYSTTQTNLVQEARYLGNLYFGTKSMAQPMQGNVQQLLRGYRDSVLNDEWKSMERGEASPKTQQWLTQIGEAYMHATPDVSGGVFLSGWIQELSSMVGLRASRLDDSSSGLLPLLWFVLLTGAVAMIGFSFLFGAYNFKAQAVMTVLLTGVISMTFYTIVSLDFPFTGATTISSEPFRNLEMK